MIKNLLYLPENLKENGLEGITIGTDYGLGKNEISNLIVKSGEYINYVRFDISAALSKEDIKERIQLYRDSQINTFFCGTLFEAYHLRNSLEFYINVLKEYGIKCVEVSDSLIKIPHDEKIDIIQKLSKDFIVFSKVGSRLNNSSISIGEYADMINSELNAGALKIVIEGGGQGTSGLYDKYGEVQEDLIHEISKIAVGNLIFEAKKSSQQSSLINRFGPGVNLANISLDKVLELEKKRLGLSELTFFNNIPGELKSKFSKKINPWYGIDFQI